MAYIGQSGRPITTRHRKNTRYIWTNNPNSVYVTHILNNEHVYGTANEMLKLLKPCNKGLEMNCWESFYIKIYRQRNRIITEQLTGDYNPLKEQAYSPHELQHIPWHSLDQIGSYTHTHIHTPSHTHTHTHARTHSHRRNASTYSHIPTLFITNVNQHSNSAT
jgi:hypothetical protein